jgi:hypothetical protein
MRRPAWILVSCTLLVATMLALLVHGCSEGPTAVTYLCPDPRSAMLHEAGSGDAGGGA